MPANTKNAGWTRSRNAWVTSSTANGTVEEPVTQQDRAVLADIVEAIAERAFKGVDQQIDGPGKCEERLHHSVIGMMIARHEDCCHVRITGGAD